MSKTLLNQNKEILVAVGLAVGVSILLLVNIIAITPGLIFLNQPATTTASKDPIDTATVNEAIRVLEVR
jgi:hypothetical protein